MNGVTCVAMSYDGRIAVSGAEDKTIKVWDVLLGKEKYSYNGHNDIITGVSLSADGRIAFSASLDNVLQIWDVLSGKLLWTFDRTLGYPVRLSADGRLGISFDPRIGSKISVWDVQDGLELRCIRIDEIGDDIAISADAHYVVSALRDNSLIVWSTITGGELQTLVGHTDWVTSVAMSGNGKIAVSSSKDNTVKVWNISNGREVGTLKGHQHDVRWVVLSMNGKLAISSSRDVVKMWDTTTGLCISTLSTNIPLKCCAISAVGNFIIGGDDFGGVHFFDLIGNKNLLRKVKYRGKVPSSSANLWLTKIFSKLI